MSRPQGVPEWYETCPACKADFRKCDDTLEIADKVYLRNQQNKARAGKTNGDMAKSINVEGVTLYLWKDGRVTWGN